VASTTTIFDAARARVSAACHERCRRRCVGPTVGADGLDGGAFAGSDVIDQCLVQAASRAPRFDPSTAARVARAERLRRDLGLNYAGAVLACELLDRISELEARLQ
jgi:hypothetical protein